jgi:hypothetical protein
MLAAMSAFHSIPANPLPAFTSKCMEKSTKRAVDRVNNHREDGEEAIKRTSKVVPIDAGRNGESVQVSRKGKSKPEKNKRAHRGNR